MGSHQPHRTELFLYIVDQRRPVRTSELEWMIRNKTDELHSFHIHRMHFQVTAIDGVPQPADGYRDVIDVPVGGEVKGVIPFTNPEIVGRFVYYCHLLSHNDKDMMATI